MRRTSGPGCSLDHTASLSGASPQLRDADHLWLSSEGGAGTRAASPSPSTPTPCSLSPSPSHFPSLSITANTCSHFTQDGANHVVSGARWSPAHSQPRSPRSHRSRPRSRSRRSGQDGEEEKPGRERAGVRERNPVPHPDLPVEADQVWRHSLD